jgi:hypothetical protein
MDKKLVLDIGAGTSPLPEATHAIDQISPAELDKTLTGEKFHKKYPKVQQYKVANVKSPPKEWEGKFDSIVSRSALGGGGLEGKAMSKALNFLTKPNATIKVYGIGLSEIQDIDKLLSDAGFTITKIETKEEASWIPALNTVSGGAIIYGQKNLKPSQSKVLEIYRGEVVKMPVPIRRITRRKQNRVMSQGLKGIRR